MSGNCVSPSYLKSSDPVAAESGDITRGNSSDFPQLPQEPEQALNKILLHMVSSASQDEWISNMSLILIISFPQSVQSKT